MVAAPLGAVVFTLAISGLLVLWAGAPVGATYVALFKGAFGSLFALSETLTRAVPLILTGLAAAVAFRARLFNIGAEGQLYAGAVAAVAGSLYAPWARIVTIEEVHWLASAQPMLNTLLGGVSSFWGPVVGAGLFAAITYATRTLVGLTELIVGCGLLTIILLAPNGAVGLWRTLEMRLLGGPRKPLSGAAAVPSAAKLNAGGAP